MNQSKLTVSVPARRWDSFRFRLSCLLFRNPITLSAGFLALGLTVGLSAWLIPGSGSALRPAEVPSQQLAELSAHLSTLDAQANRLDELGQQWVQRMGLETESFDFSVPPAQGGADYSEDAVLNTQVLVEDAAVLAARYTRLEAQLSVLENLAQIGENFPEEIPHASPSYGHMTSSFGIRHDPFGRGKRFHSGIDLAAKMGDPVMAMAGGKVVFSGSNGAYGKLVEVDHGNGYKTRYAHNSSLLAKVGDEVEVGQILAKAGSTGRSTGVHLHVEVLKDGKAVNPRPFLERGRQLLAERQAALAALDGLPSINEVKSQGVLSARRTPSDNEEARTASPPREPVAQS